MKRWLPLALLLTSCAAPARTAPAARAIASSAPAPRPSASSATPAASDAAPATQPLEPEHAEAVKPTEGAVPLVSFETPYKLGMKPKTPIAEMARREEQELEAWNQGGRQGKWHPQPRVMVDNAQVRGRISDAVVLRETRKQHYWPIRKCFDEGLGRDQTLHGKLRVQFTVKHTGAIKGAKTVGKPTLDDGSVVTCIVSSMASLKLPQTTRGDAIVTLDIGLNPGDLPVRSPEEPAAEPGSGALDVHAAQALVAGRVGHHVQQCYAQALARVPSLWGRMALRAQVDATGAVRECVESESTFPDPEATTCVIEAVRKVAFPAPAGGALRIVIPFRFGRRVQ